MAHPSTVLPGGVAGLRACCDRHSCMAVPINTTFAYRFNVFMSPFGSDVVQLGRRLSSVLHRQACRKHAVAYMRIQLRHKHQAETTDPFSSCKTLRRSLISVHTQGLNSGDLVRSSSRTQPLAFS